MDVEESDGDDGPVSCEHLAYRRSADDFDHEFETARAYCTVVDRFVQPVRADVCNARYGLSPADHCEFYREEEGIEDGWLTGESTERTESDGTPGGPTHESGDTPEGSNNDGGDTPEGSDP